MKRLMDKPLTAALWLAIFGAAASAQGVAEGERRAQSTPLVQTAQTAPVDAPLASTGTPDSAASAPRYADAPKRSPHASARSGRSSK